MPDRELADSLVDLVSGREPSVTTGVEAHLRVFTLVVGEDEAGPLERLELPPDCRVVALTRDGFSTLPGEHDDLKVDDRVLVVAHRERIEEHGSGPAPRGAVRSSAALAARSRAWSLLDAAHLPHPPRRPQAQ